MSVFAKRSSSPRKRTQREADLILNHLSSHAADVDFNRRSFLVASAAVGGGLVLSLALPTGRGEAANSDSFAPNAFIRIGKDGQVTLTMPYVEMGQGTYTSIPMLIAEELEVDLKQVRLEHAPPNEKLYGNPLPGGVAAPASSRCDCQNHAGRGGGKALER